MGKTISFAKGKGNIRHNNRDFFTDNIDRDRTPNNITYVKQDLEMKFSDKLFKITTLNRNGQIEK